MGLSCDPYHARDHCRQGALTKGMTGHTPDPGGQNLACEGGQMACANFVKISKVWAFAFWYARTMRDRIRQRLEEYRAETLERIGTAVNKIAATFSQRGTLGSGGFYLAVNEDNKAGFAEYMDRSADFIRHLARGSSVQYADELREGGTKLKQEIMAKMDNVNSIMSTLPENAIQLQFRYELNRAFDQLIKRKVEDFELGYTEGRDMNATTSNTVNIINSTISNAVVQITQSGKDAISKETALKLQELVNSEEIKALPDDDRLEVLDRVSDLIEELQAPTTDKGKVHRGLKRLADFISSVASNAVAQIVTKLATAWATS
jgi:hypothetical protein